MALSKNSIKYIKSLSTKKFRQKYNKFIVEGDKMIREILRQEKLVIESLYATESWLETLGMEISVPEQRIFKITLTELSRISSLKTPNQVLAVVDMPENQIDQTALHNDINLYLDDIQDPGNLGTILRIADWFGVRQVIRSSGTVDMFNSKVIQSTMGAFIRVNSPTGDLPEIVSQHPELPVLGAVLDGENIFELKAPKKVLLVIGNEGKGISADNMPFLSKKISIPATHNTGAESLNAAVATGIICAVLRN
jgi:TrmH family RNA methyltransferase